MAVVRANYVKRNTNERATAKANIRYIQERPGRDKKRLTRTLFGAGGSMGRLEAYQLIADAPKSTYFYRLKLSPDPATEDTQRDLNMQQLTRTMMQRLEKRLRTPVPWAAALHDDHTAIRHVHILAAIPGRLQRFELNALIREASALCQEQRRGRDLTHNRHLSAMERSTWQKGLQRSTTAHPLNMGKSLSVTRHAQKLPQTPRRGTRARSQPTCTCPRCHFPQLHDRHGVHACLSCGRILHQKRELTLQRKGRAWERSL